MEAGQVVSQDLQVEIPKISLRAGSSSLDKIGYEQQHISDSGNSRLEAPENTPRGTRDGPSDTQPEQQHHVPIPHHMNPLNLHLISHPQRGRGVFAPSSIPAGTIIEESPVLVITQKEWDEGHMNDTILGSYGFCWKDGGMGIGLGLASLFNHSSSPNVNFIRSYSTSTIKFITSKRIEKDEELCICYSADESKLWFVKSDSETQGATDMASSSDEEDGGFSRLNIDEDDLLNESSKNKDSSDDIKIQSPQPVRFSASAGPSSATMSEASSRTSTPSSSSVSIYPEASSDIITSLPPPLHSGRNSSRQKSNEEVQLTDELEWDEKYWTSPYCDGTGRANEYAECIREKGPAEREGEDGADGTMDIWTLEFTDPKLTRTALDFSKDLTATDERLRHLKRVCRRKESNQDFLESPAHERAPPPEICRIVLAMVAEYELSSLQSIISAYSSTLSHLVPVIHRVPSSIARTQEQLKSKSHLWPVSFSPAPIIPVDTSDWLIGRKAWVTSGIRRIIQIALDAKSKGELPIGTYCAALPKAFWPKKEEGFIQPTEELRASSHDTRQSENHPLRHAALNCIKSIANLRTVEPFISITPERNGSDYLLTSLTLFITHEPCVMCCMALLHSRVREVFYIFPRKKGGGFNGSELGIHARKDLNHRFEAWRYDGHIEEETRRALDVEEDLQI
uniref:SET domain-containing protein n=1 Tax=Kwoniella dejecticola CBS 10117 TaxID=1296121 RepID=A0A1A6AGN2_9TREE|nr:uncharacterized protein I303_01042 [Kwoniella dejecticola CBS 10117]OBR89217.1 hypothetical protein I303_01042 [Kwoniella dejecticola CBS 10117]